MTFQAACPHCKQILSMPDTGAGKAVRCPACNQSFKVPPPPTPVPSAGGTKTPSAQRPKMPHQTAPALPPPIPTTRAAATAPSPDTSKSLPNQNSEAPKTPRPRRSLALWLSLGVVGSLVVVALSVSIIAPLFAERSWDAAEKYLRETVSKSNQVKLIRVQKTNHGPGTDNFGSKKYTVEFECELEFAEDGYWDGCLSVQPREDPALAFGSALGAAMSPGGPTSQQVKETKGQRGRVYIRVFLDGDSHQGWRPSGHFKIKDGEIL